MVFDLEKYNSLKLSYGKAVSENKEQFTFERQILLTSYARQVYIETLGFKVENKLEINEKNEKR